MPAGAKDLEAEQLGLGARAPAEDDALARSGCARRGEGDGGQVFEFEVVELDGQRVWRTRVELHLGRHRRCRDRKDHCKAIPVAAPRHEEGAAGYRHLATQRRAIRRGEVVELKLALTGISRQEQELGEINTRVESEAVADESPVEHPSDGAPLSLALAGELWKVVVSRARPPTEALQ